MPADGERFLQSPSGALGISSIQLPDAGIYTCVATNSAGSDTAEVTVQVQGICLGPRSCPGPGWHGVGALQGRALHDAKATSGLDVVF